MQRSDRHDHVNNRDIFCLKQLRNSESHTKRHNTSTNQVTGLQRTHLEFYRVKSRTKTVHKETITQKYDRSTTHFTQTLATRYAHFYQHTHSSKTLTRPH